MKSPAMARLAAEAQVILPEHELELYQEALVSVEADVLGTERFAEDLPSLPTELRRVLSDADAAEDQYGSFITRFDLVYDGAVGNLQGRSIGLKDNIAVAGVPMTLGSFFMDGYVPTRDATVVTRLLDAGARVVGKLNMDEFSHSSAGVGTGLGDFGRCRNPHAPDHVSGASSSGSAVAVASGEVDIALGGDQGGSVRIPASWCGIVGLKPTFGLVPHTGAVGVEPTIDHIGPMARSVREVAVTLESIAGPDGYDPRQHSVPTLSYRFAD